METRANHVIAGLFVLLSIAAIAVFSLWITRSGQGQFKEYHLYFSGTVSGLGLGGPVRYRGIEVGRVKELIIDPDNPEQIRATINIRSTTPVKTDTVATLEQQGITGISYVQLLGGTNESPALEPEKPGDTPTIRTVASHLEKVFESAPDMLQGLNELVIRANIALSDKNLEALAAIMQDAQTTSDNLAKASVTLQGTMEKVAGASKTVESVFTQLADPGSVKNPGQLTITLKQVEQGAKAFAKLANNVDALLSDNRGTTSQGLYELNATLRETQQLLSSMRSFSKDLQQDPSRLLFGDQKKGYRIPDAKTR